MHTAAAEIVNCWLVCSLNASTVSFRDGVYGIPGAIWRLGGVFFYQVCIKETLSNRPGHMQGMKAENHLSHQYIEV